MADAEPSVESDVEAGGAIATGRRSEAPGGAPGAGAAKARTGPFEGAGEIRGNVDTDAEVGDADQGDVDPARESEPGEGELYTLCPRITRAWYTRLHERRPGEPLYRTLRVFALNPADSRADCGVSRVEVPYEPLERGPRGSVLEVSNRDANGDAWNSADLEHPHLLVRDGHTPSLSDPCFHQQMVYAVAMQTYDSFRIALGRHVAWAFARRATTPDADGFRRNRLLLRPHGPHEANAWYDRSAGEIVFGHFTAERSTPMVKAGTGHVFTSVSHDVIAHEMTHALLDGLRARFMEPSHPDVLAFHEALADLVAVFQHFTLENVVRSAIGEARGNLRDAHTLIDVAQEFGRGLGGRGRALRTLLDEPMPRTTGDGSGCAGPFVTYEEAGSEPHELGGVLARAVFAAFLNVYERRSRRYLKLATGGSGELPAGDLASGLQDILVSEVRNVAQQFLTICIRAVDYCPPVDVRFGDYLRALVTADHDLMPEDSLGYREALVRAFGERGVYGEGTRSMSEDELLWKSPQHPIAPQRGLAFHDMRFDGDPARPVGVAEMRRQAGVLGRLVAGRRHAREFGLVSPLDPAFRRDGYGMPLVESVRSARRVGPSREVSFDTVAEVTQARHVRLPDGSSFTFFGGSTVILGPRGEVRFVIRKRVDDAEGRMQEQIAFMRSPAARELWVTAGSHRIPAQDLGKRMCLHGGASAAAPS